MHAHHSLYVPGPQAGFPPGAPSQTLAQVLSLPCRATVCRLWASARARARQARNAFCAVRPPGHHAGPVGIVTCANDPHGSLGFCLLNNLAIGAAYAVSTYRAAGAPPPTCLRRGVAGLVPAGQTSREDNTCEGR